MLNRKNHTKVTMSTERNFGLVFGTFFLIIGLYPVLKNENFIYWSLLISFLFYFFSFVFPKILFLPNKIWFKIGMVLNTFVSPIILGIIFFFIVTPTGIIMRLLKKDLLNLNLKTSKKSYWIKRKTPLESMKKQF